MVGQPAPGVDLVGECEQAPGRMIDDDIKAAVMLKRSLKELRDHPVLESPQLANVENKFPLMLSSTGAAHEEFSFKSRQWKLQR